MLKGIALVFAALIGCVFAWLWLTQRTAKTAVAEFQHLPGAERTMLARMRHESMWVARCEHVGIRYPPRELFLRALKKERSLEIWGRNEDGDEWRLLMTYQFTASGLPGPKRREGDRQIPEGFYTIDRWNPESAFHLSLGLDYPNASDRILSDTQRPGGDIFIHGGAASIGCLAIGDTAIEELFTITFATHDTQERIPVHIFPAWMEGGDWEKIRLENVGRAPELAAFWESLRPVFEAFERTRRVPEIEVRADGTYRVRAE